jgi:hypothetical protein
MTAPPHPVQAAQTITRRCRLASGRRHHRPGCHQPPTRVIVPIVGLPM